MTLNPIARYALAAWGLIAAAGWLGYLPFVSGVWPGIHALALAYSWLALLALLLLLGAIYSLMAIGAGLLVLLAISLYAPWRSQARRGVRVLLGVLLGEALLLAATLPAIVTAYESHEELRVAPWQHTYRTVYVFPSIDDNYGDLLLLQCRYGLCGEVYRRYTDFMSAAQAELRFNPETEQVALRLESQWVQVRSQHRSLCSARRGDLVSPCEFVPFE